MVSRNFLKIGFVFFLLIFINNAYSVQVQVNIDENSHLTQLVDKSGYSLTANGVLEIYNPSSTDIVYEFSIPIELDSFIAINKVDIGSNAKREVNISVDESNFAKYTNYTNYTQYQLSPDYKNWTIITQTYFNSSSDKFTFSFDKIKGYMIYPNETIRVGYEIYGLLNYNIYDHIGDTETILNYYASDYDFVSRLEMKIDKLEREDFVYNSSDGKILESPTENTTPRMITVYLSNPTDFEYFARSIKLYRTLASDPFFDQGVVLQNFENVEISPFFKQEIDYIDEESPDNAVYWASYDFDIKNTITQLSNQNFNVQVIKKPSSSGSFGGYVFKPVNHSLIIKKDTDKTLIANGEEFEVQLRIINPHALTLTNLSLFDEIPQGYEIKDISHQVQIKDRRLQFNVDDIKDYETILVTYTLVAKSAMKGVTYLKPAKVIHGDEEYFSEGILLINDLLPSDKIFVQKEVKYLDDDFAKVTIRIKNLGNYLIEDILVNDYILEDAILKDITQMFYERGIWKIKVLKPGEEWEVSYVVSRNDKLNTLPNIFGVEKNSVYSTLIFSEEIVTAFSEQPRIIEKVGLGLAVGILIVYLLF